MSHNTRRGGFVPPNSVGQRRPQTNQGNFTPGQRPQTPQGRGRVQGNSPWNQQNRQQGPNQPNLRQQAQTFLQAQETQKPSQPQPAVCPPPPVIEKKNPPPVIEKANPPPAPEPVETPAKTEPMIADVTNGEEAPKDVAKDEKNSSKAKPFWVKGPGKINKKELRRRRNLRLRKILQPKNALMVLNELVGSTPYEVSDLPDPFNGTLFQCSVQVDGVDHIGHGKSKPAAKNAAAEVALKHMVLGKMKNLQSMDTATTPAEGDGTVKMEIDDGAADISWSHVACYALHKLLNSWDEGSNINFSEKVALGNDSVDLNKIVEKKPAKKLPELANTMNPVMLLNQMFPSAVFEEVSKEGNSPNIQFTVKCTVGNDTFYGTSSTKKAARRMCSFAACRQILGIQYAPAFLEEHGFSEDAIQVVPGSQ